MIRKMLTILSLITIANVVTSEDITDTTIKSLSPEPKNAFKFEDQPDTHQSYGLVRFEGQRYQPEHSEPQVNNERIKFEEENRIESQRPHHQKKKRRRRRPRQKLPSGPGFQNGEVPAYPARPGPDLPGQFYPGPRPYPYSGYPGQFYRPRPSATGALTTVTEALGSIAQYDDRQCVARLLCEAAGGARGGDGGGTETAGGGLLQAVTGLQPLLTLLAAYNGISSSPLFVFGRAVFLGMTSRANPGTCRYAYPDCPTDPEQLVHYLNNHNGGFFRFFAAPELSQQQNLEQFYHQLSGQNYGYYQPQQNLPNAPLQNHQNPYQFEGQNFQQLYPNQQQGFYHNQQLQPNGNDYSQQQNYQNFQNINHQRPSLYGNRYGLYGHRYPYQQNVNNFKSAKIEKRIQNTRNTKLFYNDNVIANTKWKFPGDSSFTNKDVVDNVRLGKVLKFPKDNVDPVKPVKGFVFPGSQSNRDYTNNINAIGNDFAFVGSTSVNDFRFENQYHYGIEADDDINMDGVRILYVVRGNGDPNKPEVVRLEPGQTL